MKAALRFVAGVFCGLLVAFVLVVAVELLSNVVHPLPADFGGTTEEMCRHVERYPAWVLAIVVGLWAATALIGTWTARKVGNLYSSASVGLLMLAAVILNISMLPYPLWFKIADLVAIPLAILAGARSSRRRKAASGVDVN
jgi:hypothetical protein